MHPPHVRAEALAVGEAGLNDCEISPRWNRPRDDPGLGSGGPTCRASRAHSHSDMPAMPRSEIWDGQPDAGMGNEMRAEGLEPTRSFEPTVLSRGCLPVPAR